MVLSTLCIQIKLLLLVVVFVVYQFQQRIQGWSHGVSKSGKFKWLVKVSASKGVIRVD